MAPELTDRSPADYGTEFWWYFTDRAEEDEPFLLPAALMRHFDHLELHRALPGEGCVVFNSEEEEVAALAAALARANPGGS